jgi:hypothetical protein
MNFKFNGTDADVSAVACRELNFGQDRFGEKQYPYELRVDRNEFISTYDQHYERWNQELKEDYIQCGDEDPVELKNLGYPSLAEMFDTHPKILSKVIVDYLYHEILVNLPAVPDDRIKYILG